MAKKIMIQGTCSNAGKSMIATALCRIFTQDGYKVAPFKAQNMALNSFITDDGLEMGRAQAVQAEACRITPDVRMNPILLKPTSAEGSQVIVNGEVTRSANAEEYHKLKAGLKKDVKNAFDSLSSEYDIIIIEGAGSPAEINLKEDDLSNMGTAKLCDAPVLLCGDIDRGGVFAALAGTVLLFDDEEKELVKGVMINKFRGKEEILKPGLDKLEEIIEKPVIGVVPYMDIDIDDEDSLTERFSRKNADSLIDIAVIRLPKISNFTDFNPFEYIDGVSVRYVKSRKEFKNPDLVIIPGTKNTMADLKWMRETGIENEILKHADKGGPVFGICGGYQMLGQTLSDPEGVEHGGTMKGLGLLPHNTVFSSEKVRKSEEGMLSDVGGIFSNLSGLEYKGYEMHMGTSDTEKNILSSGNIYGTYIHGIFDREEISKAVAESLMREKGIDESELTTFDVESYKQTQYDKLADYVREALDIEYIYSILR